MGEQLTLFPDAFPTGPTVFDASGIINLLGSQRSAEVLELLGNQFFIEEHTLAEITHHPIQEIDHGPVLADLTKKGSLKKIEMTSEEYEMYLALVAGQPSESLDDGESAAIAIAKFRKYAIVLDDGKARRILTRRFPDVCMTSSLQMFATLGVRGKWSHTQVRELILAVRRNARMNIVKGEEILFQNLIAQ